MNEIVIYEDGNVNLELSVKDKTIWLNANEIASIFDVNRPAIVKHIGNIYKSEELSKKTTCSILEQVAKDAKKRKMNYYNLDMIISVGYRVNSQQQKLQELDKTIQLIKQGLQNIDLSTTEVKGFV